MAEIHSLTLIQITVQEKSHIIPAGRLYKGHITLLPLTVHQPGGDNSSIAGECASLNPLRERIIGIGICALGGFGNILRSGGNKGLLTVIGSLNFSHSRLRFGLCSLFCSGLLLIGSLYRIALFIGSAGSSTADKEGPIIIAIQIIRVLGIVLSQVFISIRDVIPILLAELIGQNAVRQIAEEYLFGHAIAINLRDVGPPAQAIPGTINVDSAQFLINLLLSLFRKRITSLFGGVTERSYLLKIGQCSLPKIICVGNTLFFVLELSAI